MKTLLCAAVALVTISLISSSCVKQTAPIHCNGTDYTKYVECIRLNLIRHKRNDDCENNCLDDENCDKNCNDCNCDYCATRSCESFCSQCCQPTTCSTPSCCHRTCHAQCRTSRCRHECKRDCNDNIEQQEQHQQVDVNAGNITTIITLHTAINNTNIIDVPISINNTNVNNFSLDSSLAYPEYKPLPDRVIVLNTTTGTSENCCNVVDRPNCNPTPTWPFLNCSHPVTTECGPFCKSNTMHKLPMRNCFFGQCTNTMMYVPQPRPRCVHHPMWPYTSCGMPQQPFCGGCYSHYSSYPFRPPPAYCPPACYDEGYGMGSYYRQGPFYRRAFAHVPSCYQMGYCCFEMGCGDSPFCGCDYPGWEPYFPLGVNYPLGFGDGGGIFGTDLKEEVSVETLDGLPVSTPAGVDVRPPVTVEASVNSTRLVKPRKHQSNKATVTIESVGRKKK